MTYRSIIYHYPYSIRKKLDSGSQVHVTGMLEGFRQLQYDVAEVSGPPSQRSRAITRLREEISTGRRFDFLFAWAPVSPMLRYEQNFLHPFLDFSFFRWCKNQSVPIGLFYGDVHWRFDHFKKHVPVLKRIPMILLFWYDWIGYLQWVDHLFLPSLRMRAALPTRWPEDRVTELLPGCHPSPVARQPQSPSGQLELLYVGGVVPPLYDLKPMFDAIEELDGVSLTVCCRPFEWERFQAYYGPIDSARIHIVHAYGKELETYYARADLFGLFWRANPYWNTTMPVKVFEAIGFGVPIVTTDGTVASRFVAQEDIGWVGSTIDEFRELVKHLMAQPWLIEEKRRRVETVRQSSTWQMRAQMVADTLLRYDRRAPGTRHDIPQ
jgi:glycosyltransferase involved in cell wall biosynthesis